MRSTSNININDKSSRLPLFTEVMVVCLFLLSIALCLCGILYSGVVYIGDNTIDPKEWLGPTEIFVIFLVFLVPALTLIFFLSLLWFVFGRDKN